MSNLEKYLIKRAADQPQKPNLVRRNAPSMDTEERKKRLVPTTKNITLNNNYENYFDNKRNKRLSSPPELEPVKLDTSSSVTLGDVYQDIFKHTPIQEPSELNTTPASEEKPVKSDTSSADNLGGDDQQDTFERTSTTTAQPQQMPPLPQPVLNPPTAGMTGSSIPEVPHVNPDPAEIRNIGREMSPIASNPVQSQPPIKPKEPVQYDPSKITKELMRQYRKYTGARDMNSDMDRWKTYQAMQGNRNASNADYREYIRNRNKQKAITPAPAPKPRFNDDQLRKQNQYASRGYIPGYLLS